VLYELTAFASLAGVWLNIRGKVASFWIWACTNLIWTVADWQHGLPQQATLQAVYFGLSIHGIVRWSRHGTPPPARTDAPR